MTIVTGPDGIRYRNLGHPDSYTAVVACPLLYDGVFYDPRPGDVMPGPPDAERVQILQRLPHVPDWPLPGPAPQYLSDDPATVTKEGDLICHRSHAHDYWSIFRFEPLDGSTRPLGYATGQDAWLISRADPEADA